MQWRAISQEEWRRFAQQEEAAQQMMAHLQAYVDDEAIAAYEARIAGEEDDGDTLDWEYDPSVKEKANGA